VAAALMKNSHTHTNVLRCGKLAAASQLFVENSPGVHTLAETATQFFRFSWFSGLLLK